VAEYADLDVQELGDVIASVCTSASKAGAAALARMVLDAGWRRQTTEQPPASEPRSKLPCPEGFHWIGKRWDTCDNCWDTCDNCGLPAIDHAGLAIPADGNPFSDARWVLDPWRPGEVGYVADPRERLKVIRRAKEAALDANGFVAAQTLRDLEKTVMSEVCRTRHTDGDAVGHDEGVADDG